MFLATFSVVYGMKLEQKVALDRSKCCKWRYFAQNRSKSAFSDAIMTYSKMRAFSDLENASNLFLATFSVVYGMKLEQKVSLDGSNCRKWCYFAEKWFKMFFLRQDDVIQQNDDIFRFRKCLQCVPSHILCGIWDEIGTKSGIRWVKMLQMAIFCSKSVNKCLFRRHYDVIQQNDGKMMSFSDFENHSKVFFTTFCWGICIKFR